MSEQTGEPGLFISRYVPKGTAYCMDLPSFFFDAAGTQRGIAIHPDDWGLLSPAQQEKVRDMMVRHSAEDGLRALESLLERAVSGGRDG
jgi:hypothetical protein